MDKNKIIERLYLEHKDHVYNYLARMANDPELAMDVTQQTFMKALSDKNFAQVTNPKAYLFTIARNTLFNEFKRKKATSLDAIEEAGNFEVVDENEAVHEETELQDLQAKIEKSIKRMPAKVKELMILRYTEDLSIKEIAAVTGRTLSDVKVNLHRARIKFESSFTNEMYAKVAASRDQCDTLTTLLAPHTNSEIPESHLQIVDKHISACKICSEDAEELKRTRVLFNLGALIAAPYILNEMMSEAIASELNLMTSSSSTSVTVNSVGKTAASSATQSAATKIVATKIMSTKMAAMIGFITVIGIGGIIIFNSLENKEKEIVAIVNPASPPITPAVTPSATPPVAPAPKVKIDPDATTIVSFKARSNKTGNYILQGLKWDIYSTANSNGKSKTGKPDLIQTSTTPNYNIILDAGYYLAKVTYKGQTQESNFVVKDDNPVNVEINFGTNANATSATVVKLNMPTIHIRRMETGTHESNPIKTLWDLCVITVDVYKSSLQQFPQMWPKQEQQIKRHTPDFNLDRGIIPEPNWSTLTQNSEDEYFSGNKYALYRKGYTYEVSKNGSCALIKTRYETAQIDDGQFSYDINLKDKTGNKSTSQAVIQQQTDDLYKGIAKNDPFQAAAFGKVLGQALLGKTGSVQEKQSLEAIEKLSELTKVSGTDTVAGEKCEYTAMGKQMGVHICYWKTMHNYPSIVSREIVLKTTIDLSNGAKNSFFGKSNQVATIFEKDIILDNKIFSVPSNIKMNNFN